MTVIGWQLVRTVDRGVTQMHNVPMNDIRPHMLSEQCACRPVEDDEAPDVWVHNAHDHREHYYEEGAKVH